MSFLVFIFLICTLLTFANTVDKQSYVLQRSYGIWTKILTPFPQQNDQNLPAIYYLCGVQLKIKPFSYDAQDCLCKKRWYEWKYKMRCRWCTHTYNWKANGLNGVFCSYKNWNQQKVVRFDTNDPKNVGYRSIVMCPQGTYAKSVNGGFGLQRGADMGLNGLLLDCQPASQSKSITVQSSLTNQWSSWGTGKNGYFVSGYKLKYVDKNMLTGIELIFEAMPEISEVILDYNLNGIQYKPFVIESKEIENDGSQTIQSSQIFSKQLTQERSFDTSNSYTKGYIVSAEVGVKYIFVQAKISTSIYEERTSSFSFGEAYTSTWISTQSITILVPPFKKVVVDQIVYQQNVNLPFTAYVTFRNIHTKQIIGKGVIEGVYKGIDFQKIVTKLKQTNIVKS